jgi:hypothetical protein
MLLPDEWKVPAIFRQRLGDRPGRQRAMFHDGHLLLVLHRLPAVGESQREGVLFWREPDGTWHNTGRGDGLAALRRHVESFAEAVDELERMYEQASDATGYYRVIGAVAPIHRSASHLHAALQSGRDLLGADREMISLRDRAGEIERAAELLHADALNAANLFVAQRSEELARSSHELSRAGHRLNMLVTLLLPLTALAGIFGMRLSSGLEESGPWLFWLIVLLGVIIGLSLRQALRNRGGAAHRGEDPDEILRSAAHVSRNREVGHVPTPREQAKLLKL